MRVTIKGQVTIPQEIRKKLSITPAVEIDFIEEKDRVYLVKRNGMPKTAHAFRKLRGIGNVKMTTDEIMALTRGDIRMGVKRMLLPVFFIGAQAAVLNL